MGSWQFVPEPRDQQGLVSFGVPARLEKMLLVTPQHEEHETVMEGCPSGRNRQWPGVRGRGKSRRARLKANNSLPRPVPEALATGGGMVSAWL